MHDTQVSSVASQEASGVSMRDYTRLSLFYVLGGVLLLLLPPANILEVAATGTGLWLTAKYALLGGAGLLLIYTAGRRFNAVIAQLRALQAEGERLVEELQTRNEQLSTAMSGVERASRAKTRFLANMSHELRTPLNAIIGFSEVICEQQLGPLGTPKYRDYARDIHNSGIHLLSLIKDILEMATIESGKLELKEQELVVPDLVASAARLVAQQVEKAGLRLDVDVARSIPPVLADERAIRQVLINLLGNALKFTPAGGHITLTAALDAERRLLITVTDTGIGIDPDHIEKITQPFVQLHSSETATAGGSGLGLSISKELVELHGGTLQIQSKVGVGTSVCVALPSYRLCEQRHEEHTIYDLPKSQQTDFNNCLMLSFRGRNIEVFEGSGTFVIGRNRGNPDPLRCDLVVDDLRVSRPHAKVQCIEGEFYLIDVSRRGTYLRYEDGTTISVTRDNPVKLPRSGVISLGVDPQDNGTNLIHFERMAEAPSSVGVRAA